MSHTAIEEKAGGDLSGRNAWKNQFKSPEYKPPDMNSKDDKNGCLVCVFGTCLNLWLLKERVELCDGAAGVFPGDSRRTATTRKGVCHGTDGDGQKHQEACRLVLSHKVNREELSLENS